MSVKAIDARELAEALKDVANLALDPFYHGAHNIYVKEAVQHVADALHAVAHELVTFGPAPPSDNESA